MLNPGLVVGDRHHLDLREHRRVLEAAELGTLAAEGAELRRPESQVVGPSRNRVDLAAERGDPPAVVDVVRDDRQAHRLVERQAQVVDRDRAVGVDELPVVLVRVDRDLHLGAARSRRAEVGDLPEDEPGDHCEQDDRAGGPGELEVRVAAHLRAFDLARAASAAVPHEEDDQGHDYEQEDRAGHGEDEPVDVADVARARRRGVGRREPAVAR